MPDYPSELRTGVALSDWTKYHNFQNTQLAVKNHTNLYRHSPMPVPETSQIYFILNRPVYPT